MIALNQSEIQLRIIKSQQGKLSKKSMEHQHQKMKLKNKFVLQMRKNVNRKLILYQINLKMKTISPDLGQKIH